MPPISLGTPPASDPDWIIANPGNGTEPTGSQKDVGYMSNQKPTFQNFNWLFYNVTLWIRYFVGAVNALNNTGVAYEASIGTGGTYADINAAMADGGLPAGSRLLVLNSLVLTTTQQITKVNTQIDLRPGVVLSDGGAATGIRISATGVRIRGGKLSGFSVAAFLIDLASDFSMIGEMRFFGNTNDITDNNGKGTTYALIDE